MLDFLTLPAARMNRVAHKTRQVKLGDLKIGGDAPISVQSMCNTDTRDIQATLAQIAQLTDAGCEIVRCAVPDQQAADCLGAIRKGCPIPLVADIHFDYRLALTAVEQGVDCLRLNPGNIGARWKVEEVVRACAERQVPIRIGVNAGSLEPELLRKYGHPTAGAMVESALGHISILEDLNFSEIKVSMKASDIKRTVEPIGCWRGRSIIRFMSELPKLAQPGAAQLKAPLAWVYCSTMGLEILCAFR